MTLHEIAKALGGDVVHGAVVAPGPGHSRSDRSLSIKLSPNSPDGFLVHSFAADDFRACRDHVADRLGISRERREPRPMVRTETRPAQPDPSENDRVARAVAIWNEGQDPRGTVVERYLATRDLSLPHDVASAVLRYHPACPWRDQERNETIRVPAMLGAMRQISGNQITAIHRTRLTPDGVKVDRRMLGIAGGAAIKLDGDDMVTQGLAIGEGIETCLAARQLGLRPAWALASAGAIASFPVLPGVDAIMLLAENDAASDSAITDCGARWHAAGRGVVNIAPRYGSDLNDAIRRRGEAA